MGQRVVIGLLFAMLMRSRKTGTDVTDSNP
jgi:hypothetical protein